jgi:membrane protein
MCCDGAVSVLSRTLRRYVALGLSDWAAALTYYAVLSLFPALLVLVALLGVFGQYPETTNAILRIARSVAPPPVLDSLRSGMRTIVLKESGHATLLAAGLLGALWSASSYVGAFTRASNVIYGASKRRFIKQRSLQIGITVLLVVMVAIIAAALVVSGPVAEAVGRLIGLQHTTVLVWDIAKWPVLLAAVVALTSLLYRIAPNVHLATRRGWVTPGGLVAVVVGILASMGFGFYVANFNSYDRTYGSLGAVIIFLVWIYMINNALLFGALLDAERAQLEAAQAVSMPPRVRLPQRRARA